MARPRKQTVDYFPHDASASSGMTLSILQHEFGNDGYAFWFRLLELLARSPDHVFDTRNPARWGFLQAITHVSEDLAGKILGKLADLDAICPELWHANRVIWSDNFVLRVADVYQARHQPKPEKPVIDPHNPPAGVVSITDNISSAVVSIPDNTQTKLKETKLNKTKLKRTAAAAAFEEYSQTLKSKFSTLDFTAELEKCNLYWEGKPTKRNPNHKLRLLNWLTKAQQIADQNNGGAHGKTQQYSKKIGGFAQLPDRDHYTDPESIRHAEPPLETLRT